MGVAGEQSEGNEDECQAEGGLEFHGMCSEIGLFYIVYMYRFYTFRSLKGRGYVMGLFWVFMRSFLRIFAFRAIIVFMVKGNGQLLVWTVFSGLLAIVRWVCI